jgi:hypothetical protein
VLLTDKKERERRKKEKVEMKISFFFSQKGEKEVLFFLQTYLSTVYRQGEREIRRERNTFSF